MVQKHAQNYARQGLHFKHNPRCPETPKALAKPAAMVPAEEEVSLRAPLAQSFYQPVGMVLTEKG